MEKLIIHQMRGCAPDKIQLAYNQDSYRLVHHDFTNLVSYEENQVESLRENEYILAADEGDIKFANQLSDYCNSRILLPKSGDNRVIDFNKYVPKDSKIYEQVARGVLKDIGLTYPKYITKDFCKGNPDELIELVGNRRVAIKSCTGSGSRGVLLIDKDRLYLGGKYRESLTYEEAEDIINYSTHQDCNLIIQDLIPDKSNLMKINVDFVIRDGELLGYKWDEVAHDSVFTNWNYGWFIRNEYTEKFMKELTLFLTASGVTDAIMNFEAFSDNESETHLVEFNWRYSNSMFEWQSIDEDPIDAYLNDRKMKPTPGSRTKFSRYWQCMLYDDVPSYVDGI